MKTLFALLILSSCTVTHIPAEKKDGPVENIQVTQIKVEGRQAYAKLKGRNGWYPVNDTVKVNSTIPVIWVPVN